jgi:MFS family permease
VITQSPFTQNERRSVFGLASLYSARMIGLFMVLPVLVVYGQELPGASPALLGLALGIYGLTQALLQIPLGALSDRIGRKPVILAGLVVFAAGSVVAAYANSVWWLVFGRALQGAGAIAGAVMALLADSTRSEQRTKAMAIVGISIGASFAVALMLGPALAAWGGLRLVFLVTAGLAVLGVFITLWRIPSAPILVEASEGADTHAWYKNADLWRLNAGVFVLHFTLTAAFMVVPLLLLNALSLPKELHWQVYAPVLLASVVGLGLLMRLGERSGYPKLAFGLAVLCLSAALWAFESRLGQTYIGLFGALWCFFVGFNFLEASLPSLLSKRVTQRRRGAAMGSFSTSQFAGAFLGGSGGGLLLQNTSASTLLFVCIVLLATWFLWFWQSAVLLDNALK